MVVAPFLLFTRLAAITWRENDVEKYFDFEPDKTLLCNIFFTPESMRKSSKPNSACVLNEGALLNHVHWEKGVKFSKIPDKYIKYVRKNYSSVIIVIFARYNKTTSVKLHEYAWRSVSKGSSWDIDIKVKNPAPYSKDHSLSNANKKSKLITLLAERFAEDGQKVYVCVRDADSEILEIGVGKASQ